MNYILKKDMPLSNLQSFNLELLILPVSCISIGSSKSLKRSKICWTQSGEYIASQE